MQLRLSFITVSILAAMALNAQDYVSVEYLQYNENDDRTNVSAPSIMINKDFGTDYTLNATFVVDAVSGATQTYYDSEYDGGSSASYDASSGASASSRGLGIDAQNIKYGNVEYDDTRVSGSFLVTKRFATRDELRVGVSRSNESDFYSTEISSEYMHYLDSSKNQSLSVGASYQYNQILRHCTDVDGCSGASQEMNANAVNARVAFSQNIDTTSKAEVALFYSNDDGYLNNPYLNVVRNYTANGTGDIVGENRPDTKMAYGVALKYAKAMSDTTTLHLGYRYYSDDWGIDSHTLDTDVFHEVGDDWIFKLGLRRYIQTQADFFSPYIDYFTNEQYASSDARLSDFYALTYKASVDYKINDEVSVNFGANYYDQSTGLSATYFVTGFMYNF